MEFDKIKNKGQGRLFKSELLEMMSKTHPLVIFSIYLPTISFMLYYGVVVVNINLIRLLFYFILGLLTWTFFEYIMHRFLFHYVTNNPRLKNLVYTFHGVHHEYPRDKDRLFMPPIPSLILSSSLFGLFYLIMGWNVLSFFPGFVIGYLMYGSMHYAIHAFTPPKFLKALWRNHHLHHYKYPNLGFGVSSVIWDHIFKTIPPKK